MLISNGLAFVEIIERVEAGGIALATPLPDPVEPRLGGRVHAYESEMVSALSEGFDFCGVPNRIDGVVVVDVELSESSFRQYGRAEASPQIIAGFYQVLAARFDAAGANFIPDDVRQGVAFEAPLLELCGDFPFPPRVAALSIR